MNASLLSYAYSHSFYYQFITHLQTAWVKRHSELAQLASQAEVESEMIYPGHSQLHKGIMLASASSKKETFKAKFSRKTSQATKIPSL
jgi:DNA-binding phage protein